MFYIYSRSYLKQCKIFFSSSSCSVCFLLLLDMARQSKHLVPTQRSFRFFSRNPWRIKVLKNTSQQFLKKGGRKHFSTVFQKVVGSTFDSFLKKKVTGSISQQFSMSREQLPDSLLKNRSNLFSMVSKVAGSTCR